MSKIKTVLFDLDGTLIDSRRDLTNAVNYALNKVGMTPQAEEEIVPHIGNGLRVLLSEVMGPVSDETLAAAIAAFSEFYDAHCVEHTTLYEGVDQVLREVGRGRGIGIVTNKPERFARKIVNELGIGNLIAAVVGGDSLAERKPHPAPVLKAMRELGGHSETVLVVGDGAQDIQAGQAAGTLTCVARYGFGFRNESLVDLKPNFQIDRFIELKEIV